MGTKTRIAFLIGNLNKEHGGAQQLLYDICSNLPQDEFDLTVYHMFGEGTFTPHFESRGVQVVNLRARGNYDTRTFGEFLMKLRQTEPDILHTNSPISGIWGRIAGTIAGVSNIISVEHSVHTSYRPIPRIANGITLPLADTVVGVSEAVTDSFPFWERFLLGGRTTTQTIPNGVDVEHIESQLETEQAVLNRLPFSKEDKIIGTVGRLIEQKGLKYLIESMPAVIDNHPQAKLLVLGDGPQYDYLNSLTEDLNISEEVYFPGYVDPVFPYLPHLDVAVFPSLGEGFGLAVAEAMVAKRPIVGTDIDAFQQVIGDTGTLVEPANSAELERAIDEYLSNPKRREQDGERGYQRVVEKFSIQTACENYRSLYHQLQN